MSEATPQFTYTADGILHVGTEIRDDDPIISKKQREYLEQLADTPGVIIDAQQIVHTDVREALGHEFRLGPDNEDTTNFLRLLGRLIPYGSIDKSDRVLVPLHLYGQGLATGVYEQFQRWANTQTELNEGVAKATLKAMSVPFGKKIERDTVKSFRYYGGRATAISFDLTSYPAEFGIRKYEGNETEGRFGYGRVNWNWVDLTTLGSCACLGVTGDERERIDVSADRFNPWLYEMTDHNIDFARQSLSLLMGLGVLARTASEYEGHEDILEQAEWQED